MKLLEILHYARFIWLNLAGLIRVQIMKLKVYHMSAVEIAAELGTSAAAVKLWRRTGTFPKNAIICAKYRKLERLISGVSVKSKRSNVAK